MSGLNCSGFVSSIFNDALEILLVNSTFTESECADAGDQKIEVTFEVSTPRMVLFKISGYGVSLTEHVTDILNASIASNQFVDEIVALATASRRLDASDAAAHRRLSAAMAGASVDSVVASTFAPTSAPTPSPTPIPSPEPSPRPTSVPIPAPTSVPIPAPTPRPSWSFSPTSAPKKKDDSDDASTALGFGLGIPLGAIAMGGAFYLMTQGGPKPPPPSPHTLPPEPAQPAEVDAEAIELGVVEDTHVDGMLNSGAWTEC
jgi:hypothetical protein